MSDFSDNFGPAAAELLRLRGDSVEYRGVATEGWESIVVNLGPEETKIVDLPSGTRELMRVRSAEFATDDFPGVTPERSGFRIDDEVWTVSVITSRGAVLTVAEIVRPERADRAGRARPVR